MPGTNDRDASEAGTDRRFYEAAIDGLPGVFYAFTAEGRMLRWNHALERVSGYGPREIAAMSPSEFFRPEDQADVRASIERALRVGVETFERPLRSKDGTVTPYSFTSRRLAVDGAPCVVGMGMDVSALQRAVEGQRGREDLLRRIIEQSPLSMAIVGADARIEYINRCAVQTFGYTLDDIPTMEHWWALAYPDPVYRAEVLAQWGARVETAVRLGAEIERHEYRTTCRDGSVKTLIIFGAIVGDKAFVMFEDITARQQANRAALQEREDNLTAMAENANDGILIASADGRLRYANRRVAALAGVGVDELIGRDVASLVAAAAARRPETPGQALAATPQEAQLQGGDGSLVPVEISTALTEWDREPAYLIVVRDVRERKRAELERERLRGQLAQAQKMESLGTLAGGIAHDFNNLLAAILANLELARADVAPDAPVAESLEAIAAAAARATQLVRQILAFSRQQPIHRSVTSLGGVVAEVARLLRATLPAGIQIETHEGPDVPAVFVDPTQLHQVLMNLGTNAWHAIERTTGHLWMRLDGISLPGTPGAPPGVAAGRYARLQVVDDGKGMDDATLGRIFEPFFTTKGVEKGTGLGLAVVHGIVAEHGGAITVESAPGRGTTFSVWLPMAEASHAVAAPVARVARRGVGHVLLLDDEHALVRVGTRILTRLGYEVTGFLRSGEAIAAVASAPARFDVVVTDQNMPDHSGLEVAREIRALRPGLPVVLVTGNRVHTDAELTEAGVTCCLEKPYTGEAIAAILDQVLRA